MSYEEEEDTWLAYALSQAKPLPIPNDPERERERERARARERERERERAYALSQAKTLPIPNDPARPQISNPISSVQQSESVGGRGRGMGVGDTFMGIQSAHKNIKKIALLFCLRIHCLTRTLSRPKRKKKKKKKKNRWGLRRRAFALR